MGQLPSLIKADDEIAKLIYASYEKKERKGQSERLGASELGRECDRAIWYGFRWASPKTFAGRMLRLFSTGQREEARVVEDLRSIGCIVRDVDETGKQHKIVDSHLVGKIDGLVAGVPQAPKTVHILEVKTANTKTFAKLKDGVRKAKPEHYAQIQMYLYWWKLERALYVCVCKDTDDLYTERVDYDKAFAEAIIARGKRIIGYATPPERISKDRSFFLCRFCDHYDVCWNEKAPQVNCRTCLHATPEASGEWSCQRHNVTVDYQEQQQACGKHLFIPALVPNSIAVDAGEDYVEYESNGEKWRNGEGFVTSKEIAE